MKQKYEQVEDELNGIILYKKDWCPTCKKDTTFMNVGNLTEEFICLTCTHKISFEKKRLVINKFGYYFKKGKKE